MIDFQEEDSSKGKKKVDFQLDFQEEPSGESFMDSLGGTAAALGDIASGLIKVPAGVGMAIGGKLRNSDISTEAHRMAAQDVIEKTFPSIGQSVGGANTHAYKNIMKPFELLGEGIDWAGDKLGRGNKDVSGAAKLGLDAAGMVVGIPGSKAVGKGMRAFAEKVDPGLRNAGKEAVQAMERDRALAKASSKVDFTPDEAKAAASEIDKRVAELHDASIMQRLKEIDRSETANERRLSQAGAKQVNGDGTLFIDQNGIAHTADTIESYWTLNPDKVPTKSLSEMTPEEFIKLQKDASAWKAQQQIDARQADMEFGVKRQTTLEQNALERARQEQGDTGTTAYLAEGDKKIQELSAQFEELQKQLDSSTAERKATEAADEAAARQHSAQDAITQRQLAMELDVKRDATLAAGARQMALPDQLALSKVEEHPLVQAADKRVTAAEETLIKASQAVEEGRMSKAQLNMLERDLENLQKRAQLTRDNIVKGLKDKTTPEPFNYNDQKIINFNTGFNKDDIMASIDALRNASKSGTGIQTQEKQKSAAEMTLKDILKRDVEENRHTHTASMFKAQVFEPERRPAYPAQRNKQGGWIDLGDGPRRQLEKVLGRDGTMIPNNPDPKVVVEAAKAEGKDGGAMTLQESGSTSAWMKRGSALIQGVGRTLQNALKAADLNVHKMVLPVERSVRKLSSADIQHLEKTMMAEMKNGSRFSLDTLESLLKPKQLEAYAHIRAMFDDTLRIQNEARAAKGQKPITEVEAYLSSRWKGDFRRPLYETVVDKGGNPKINEDGSLAKKLVWYLAADTKRGLEAQTATLLKDRPDLTFDPKDDHTVRYYKRQTDLQSNFSTILDILGRDDPAIEKIQKAIQEQTVNEGASFLGQEKHFKEKAGVRGLVGDRPGADPAKEARAFFQQQIQYAKNAYRWSEIQKASENVKGMLTDEDLVKQQPNNVRYAREYYKNVIGYGEKNTIAHIEDSIRDLGISPSVFDKGVGGLKTAFILQKLFSLGYVATNAIQTTTVLPYVRDIRSKYGGDNISNIASIPIGIFGGLAMASGHYIKYLGGKFDGPDNFFARAFKYAEDNGATARSIYDESPIESSFSTAGMIGNVMGKGIAIPEVFIRSMAFMTYAHALEASGKFKNDIDLFQKAEEYTNKSMVDYRASERPMAFSKLGILGNALNTLQTYPASFYNQWSYFAREAKSGNVQPFIAAFALQYALAGAMGMPYMNDMLKGYEFIKDNVLPTSLWQKTQESKFWSNPKLWTMEHFGQPAVYGVLSDKTGIGMTNRITAPGLLDMAQAPGSPFLEAGKQAINWGSAALDPTNSTKWAQAIHSSTPVGLQGLLETSKPMEGIAYDKRGDGKTATMSTTNFADHRDIYNRTPEENTIRKFGFRSQKETVERELGYMANKNDTLATNKAKGVVDTFYDAVKRGDKKDAQKFYDLHVKLTGSGISDAAMEQQIKQNYFSTIERSADAAKTVTALQNVKRTQDILRDVRKEAGK